jgi:hypothetical protein
MRLRQKIANWVYSNIYFPNGCKSGNELDFLLKDNCPCCISEPLEQLSNEEYHKKYPAENRITLGVTTIYLCNVHFHKLEKLMEEMINDNAKQSQN